MNGNTGGIRADNGLCASMELMELMKSTDLLKPSISPLLP
jgi:hypothetical protein